MDNTYIIDIQASKIMKDTEEGGQAVSTDKMYTASIPYSLEVIKLKELAPNKFKVKNEIETTDIIINVRFSKSYYSYLDMVKYRGKATKNSYQVTKNTRIRDKRLLGIKELRTKLYTDGFILNGNKYVEYKRSGGKAKTGSHLFIQQKYYNRMMEYSRLGLKYPKNPNISFDLTSAKAYETLVGSAIKSTIQINRDEILVLKDIVKESKQKVNLVSIGADGLPKVEYIEDYDLEANITDGEGLLCSSLFSQDKCMMLLRNIYFKSCVFSCDIQKFFKDKGITQVVNAYGQVQDATKVKLIITTSSVKIYKVQNLIDLSRKITKEEGYNYWINNIPSTFGVVKSEYVSNYGDGQFNKLSYQMINSLPLKRADIKELLKTDFEYITNMKKYPSVFRDYINANKISLSKNFVGSMITLNEDFCKTKLYKNYLNDTIQSYKDKMYKGKISVRGDYATLCSSPYELLLSSLYQDDHEEFTSSLQPILNKDEVYNPSFKLGQEIVLMRNPHICSANVLVSKNTKHKLLDRYFNFKRGVMVVSPLNSDFAEVLNGADFDSDTTLCVIDPIIIKAAKEVQKVSSDFPCFATPIRDKKMEREEGKPKYNTPESLTELDEILSKNKIGEIVNLSQYSNSLFWFEYYKGENADKNKLIAIQDITLILAVLSNIEIDKSKKEFDLNMDDIIRELKDRIYNGQPIFKKTKVEIKQKKYTDDELEKMYNLKNNIKLFKELKKIELNSKEKDIELLKQHDEIISRYQTELNELSKRVEKESVLKLVKPYFMKFICESESGWSLDINCPMNYVYEEVKSNPCKSGRNIKTIYFNDLIKAIPINDGLRKTRKKFFERVLEMHDKQISFRMDKELEEDYKTQYNRIQQKTINSFKNISFNVKTTMCILAHLYGKEDESYIDSEKDIRKYRVKALGVLDAVAHDSLMECLKLSKSETISRLVKDENGDITIWGDKYKIISEKNDTI